MDFFSDVREWLDQMSVATLLGLLTICILLVYPLDGVLFDLSHGSNQSGVVAVLSELAWHVYNLIQVALILFLIVGAYRRFFTRRRRFD